MSKTSVRLADDDPHFQSYAFNSRPAPASGNNGWFSGLRAKIAQLTGVSEWMSQLGLRDDNSNNMASPTKSAAVPTTSNRSSRVASSPEDPNDFDYDDETLSFRSIILEECPHNTSSMQDLDGVDNWDFTASFLADIDSGQSWNDTLQRQHFGPLSDLITAGGESKAKTHNFAPVSLLHPTWCDKCGDFIWGILKQAIKCQNCNYTCHERCRELVTLDCRSAGSSLASGEFASLYPPLPDGTLGTIPKGLKLPGQRSSGDSDKENGSAPPVIQAENPLFSPSKQSNSFTLPKSFAPVESPTAGRAPKFVQTPAGVTLRVVERYVKEDTPMEWTEAYQEDDLARRIAAYNSLSKGMDIILAEDGATYHGHLHIHMNFVRPISVVQGEKPPTVYDVVHTGKSAASTLRTITSFFLPRNTVKTINIHSKTTARKMIVALLRKFRVADNPKKFALYECEQHVDASTLLRKMVRIADDACPLKVVLGWGSVNCGKALVLQENDTGDILWDAFEIPELENFVRILSMEEQQYVWQTRQRYSQYRYNIDDELRRRGYYVGESATEAMEAAGTFQNMDSVPTAREPNEYGTSDSMVISDVFATMKPNGTTLHRVDPEYVNLDFLKNDNQSTRL